MSKIRDASPAEAALARLEGAILGELYAAEDRLAAAIAAHDRDFYLLLGERVALHRTVYAVRRAVAMAHEGRVAMLRERHKRT